MARKEKPRYDGRCREPNRAGAAASEPGGSVQAIRSMAQVVVDDVGARARSRIDNAELDDLIIARSDGTPTYNFCVVVDDYDMGITHVIRGDDHMNNTPRQINMLRAMGAEPADLRARADDPRAPTAPSSRSATARSSVLQYRDDGFLPEALLNYLVRLGWSHGDQEIFSIDEMIELFDIADVNKSASALNLDKMLWTNQQHMLRSTPEHLAKYLKPQLEALGLEADDMERVAAVAKAQQERAKTLKEMAENSRFFFSEVTSYDEKAAAKNLTAETAPILAAISEKLAELPEWRAPAIHIAIMAVAAEKGVGLGKVAQPIRVAVCGGTVSPPIDVTLESSGRARRSPV